MYHYIYITTNIINGKQYVGDRSCKCNPKEDNYLGSGILFLKKIKQYKKKNFRKKILEIFETREEAALKESSYIKKYNTLVPNGYNLHKEGGTSFYKHSQETKGEMNKWRRGKSYEEIYGKKKADKIKEKQRENNAYYWKGKQKDPESVKKSAIGHQGNTHSQETKDKIRNSLSGIKHTEERRRNISIAHKGKDFSKNFGPIRYGKDNPNFIELSEKQIKEIIRLHVKEFKTVKQIAPIIGVGWAKILKILRENNSYIEYKDLLKMRKIINIV